MDYEKAYNEALERARQLNADNMLSDESIEEIFHELKESEDERIRKNCIHFLELQKEHHASTFEIEECLAYLERQKEQQPAENGDDLIFDAEEYTSKVDCGKYGVAVTEAYIAGALRERGKNHPAWKPSEEQMKALEEVRTIFHHYHLLDEINPILYDYEELMRDLQKLL